MNSTQMKMTKKNHSIIINEVSKKNKKKKKSVAVIDSWRLFCCCLAQVVQLLPVDHPMLWSTWLAWLTYSVDSGWWPLITVILVSKY